MINLQQVACVVGIGACEDLLKVLEKDFACYVVSEHLLLEGLARPIRKNGRAEIENGFIQEGNNGENG
jgi:hypothetical protein